MDQATPRFIPEIPTPGHQTGIVLITCLLQFIQEPKVAAREPTVGKSESGHCAADCVFEQFFGSHNVFAPGGFRQIKEWLMQKSATGDLMPIVRDATDDFRVSIRDPSQDEECGFGSVFVE